MGDRWGGDGSGETRFAGAALAALAVVGCGGAPRPGTLAGRLFAVGGPAPGAPRPLDGSVSVAKSRGPRTRRLIALAAVATLATAVGCGSSSSGGGAKAGPGVGARLVGHVQPVTLGALTAKDVGRAQTAFGLDVLARRCSANPNANDVLSPASAALALSMLDTGAKGATRQAISLLLHLPPWSPQLLAALHDQHQALTLLKQLQVSNHLYTQLGVHPEQGVLDDLATSEGADLQTLDFAGHAKQATDAINARVDTDTHRLIHKLFDDPLDANTTTVLTNALYLDAKWKQPFPLAHPGTFHTAAGRDVTTPLMNSAEDAGQIRQRDGWTSATLPYTGGQLEAVVMLPPNTKPCAIPTAAQTTALTTGIAGAGSVEMPKLHLSQTSELTSVLEALGLPLSGDYSGFGTPGSISQIVQKTVLQVDERGTKAAAATGGAIATSLGPHLTADRPYLMLIRDTATGTPLFLRRISDPTAAG